MKRRFEACALAVLLCVLALGGNAAAHHDSTTSRVSVAPNAARWRGSAEVSLPRWSTALGYQYLSFTRVLEGSEPYVRGQLGSAFIHSLSVTSSVELASRTGFGASLPFGWVRVHPPSAPARTLPGFGDAMLFAEKEVLGSGTKKTERRWELWPRVALVAPTGRYEEGAALSLSDLRAASDGSLTPVTYDARASLGSGVFSAAGGLELRFAWQPRVGFYSLSTVTQPLSETSDGIRWGMDLESTLGTRYHLVADRLGLQGQVSYRLHRQDQIPILDEDTGITVTESVGGRHEIGAGLGVFVGFARGVACTVRGQLPVWQYAGGVQLMQTFSAGVACSLDVRL